MEVGVPLKHNLTPSQLEALYEILNHRAPASWMRLEYRAGDLDLGITRRGEDYPAVDAEWGRPDADRPALEFSGTFRETLPLSLRKEILTVDLIVTTALGELKFRRFTGQIRKVTPGPDGTEIQAASGGYWLDKVRFDETVSYTDVAPSEVVWDCITRAEESGVYNLRYADIEQVEGPKVRREEFLLNLAIDKLARPIAAAVEEADLFFRDSPQNGPMCHRDRGPAEAESVDWNYVVGEDVNPVDFQPETEGDEFDAVVPYRTLDDGSIDFILEIGNNPETRYISIPGSVAPLRASYEINISDESDTANEDVYHMCMEAAMRLRDGEARTTQNLMWPHPLLVDGDFVGWVEPFDESTRSGLRHWIAKIETIKETHDLKQEHSYLMVPRREEEESVPIVSAYRAARTRGA